MLTQPQCLSCFLHDFVGAMETLGLRESDKRDIIEKGIGFLNNNQLFQREPSYFITGLHRILKEHTGIKEPFNELRTSINKAGMRIAEEIRQNGVKLDEIERFRYYVLWSIAGNHMDIRTIGAGYDIDPEKIKQGLEEVAGEGFLVDHTEEIYEKISEAQSSRLKAQSLNMLFIHDNVGEIALDRVLIEEITGYGHKVISALRDGPITSDATLKDGYEVGLNNVSSDIVIAGPDTLGISWEEMYPEMREAIGKTDMIISKGQANYYVISENYRDINKEIVFLLRTKCNYITRSLSSMSRIKCGNIAFYKK